MFEKFALYPDQASTVASRVDALYFFLTGLTLFFSVLIFVMIFYFAVKYRRGSAADRSGRGVDTRLEAVWIVIPLFVVMTIFFWSSSIAFDLFRPPADALEVYVTGRQWMWKIQHPSGRREINELHVPLGRPVKLTMISQDVIHSFFIPAFRVKMDVLPGRYTTLWFEATQLGEFHLFCTEYCGTKHAGMIGKVVVMEPTRYEAWLAGGGTGESLAVAGERLFQQYGCSGCHSPGSDPQCPLLDGLYERPVPLEGGQTAIADDAYLRESILRPQAKIVAGYKPIMPTYQNLLGEQQVMQLLAYIKSLKNSDATEAQ